MSERIEILVSGYGGQGVIRVGQILGQASVNQGLYTTMLISHGTETRGGYVRSQVVISDEFIDSPVVERPDYFLAFSPIAYAMFKGLTGSHSQILYNPDIVTRDPELVARHLSVPAESLALKELGDQVYANMIFLGSLSFQLPLLSENSLLQAMQTRLPVRFSEQNRRAYELGRQLNVAAAI